MAAEKEPEVVSFDDFMNRVLGFDPDAHVEIDGDGFYVVYTYFKSPDKA